MPSALADVSTLAVVPQGTSGGTSYTYGVVGVTADGRESIVDTDLEASGNAVLDATNFNRLTWTDIAGYVLYKLYRTISGGAPSSVGYIGEVLPGIQVFDDTGLHARVETPSAANDTQFGSEVHLQNYEGDLNVSAEGIGDGTYQLEGSYGGGWLNEGTAITADGILVVTRKYIKVRFQNTAYTSGAPVAYVGGDTE